MPTFRYDKLVRDNIPDWHRSNGHTVQDEQLKGAKLVIDDICASQGIMPKELATSVEKKTTRKGGFLHGEYIETVTIPNEDDKWAQYCRA